VAQALLNRKPLEEVEVPVEGGKKRYRIDTITPFKPA
jgi:transcription elongation GreA/GreB family factor